MEIELELECSACGGELKGSVYRHGTAVIEPCKDCMANEYDRGF